MTKSDRRARVALAVAAVLAVAAGATVVLLHRDDIHARNALTHSRSYRAGIAAYDRVKNRTGLPTSPQPYCAEALRIAGYAFPGYDESAAMSGCLAEQNAADQ